MKKFSALLITFILCLGIFSPLARAEEEKILPQEPRVKAKAAVAYDVVADEIILEKSMHEKMYPASITKVMTALLLAEGVERDTELSITPTALEAPPFAINKNLYILYEGDTITAEDCMKGMLLPSANDMAIVAAEAIADDVPSFVDLMNEKAKELGMENTHFTNPVGLHDADHYSTAYDLALLAKAAYDNEWVRDTMATLSADINTENQPIGEITNSNELLGKAGNVGGKTGFTEEAGRCLTSSYVRDGRLIILVLLNDGTSLASKQVFTDMANFAQEAFAMKKTPLLPKGSKVDSLVADYKLFRWFGPQKKVKIPVVTKEDILLYNNTLNNTEETLNPTVTQNPDLNVFGLTKNQPVGKVSLKVAGKTYETQALAQTTTMDSIFIPQAVPYLALAFGALLLLLLLIFLIVLRIRSTKAAKRKIRSRRTKQRRRNTRYLR